MVGRRQLREKVIQYLYAYEQNKINADVLQRNMLSDIAKIYDLYVYELNFFVALHELAEKQIEIGKKKYILSETDINPNLKFVNNRILHLIIENDERRRYTSEHPNVRWDINDDIVVKTYQRIIAGKRYKDYMNSEENSFEEDQKFIGKLFLRYVAENDDLASLLESTEMSWSNDMHIANSLVQKTIGFMKESEISDRLIKIIKDTQDENFVKRLLGQSIGNWEHTEKKLEEKLQNWELERISTMDKVILIAAITEMDEFRLTASSIIINEYIEIAKIFASEKSNIFINGVLDKYAKSQSRN